MNQFPFFIQLQNLLPANLELQAILSKTQGNSHVLAYTEKNIQKVKNFREFFHIYDKISDFSGRALEFLESGINLDGCKEKLLSLYPELAHDTSRPLIIKIFRVFHDQEIKIELVCDGNRVDCRQMVSQVRSASKQNQGQTYETKDISCEDFIKTAFAGVSVSELSYALNGLIFSQNFMATLLDGPDEDNPLLLAFKNQK